MGKYIYNNREYHIDIEKIRNDFVYIQNTNNIYLDSAATSQKPSCVIEKSVEYYSKYCGNAHSKMNYFSDSSAMLLDETRRTVARFLNTDYESIIFTKSATVSLNTAILGLYDKLKTFPKVGVVTTVLEHHANIVPCQVLCQRLEEFGVDCEIKYATLNQDYTLDVASLVSLIDSDTKVVAFTASSNVIGLDIDVENVLDEIEKRVIELGIDFPYVVIDATGYVSHRQVDLQKWNNGKHFANRVCALAFSGHKMYALNGSGVLYLNKVYQDDVTPFVYGGDMIDIVTYNESTYKNDYGKYEGGTLSIGEIATLIPAIGYIQEIGYENIQKHFEDLSIYLKNELSKFDGIDVYAPCNTNLVSIHSNMIHSHDIATILSYNKIATRAGHHCAMILHNYLQIPSTLRVSFSLCTTYDEIDSFIQSLRKVWEIFKNGR